MRRYSTRKREAIGVKDIFTKIFGTKEDKQLKQKAIEFFKNKRWKIDKIKVINQNDQKFITNGSDIYLVYNGTKDQFDAHIINQIDEFVVGLINQLNVTISSFDKDEIETYLRNLQAYEIVRGSTIFIRIK